jgi:two-component system response regulator AtoC
MSLPGILVVDDDPHARGLLRRLLGPLGQVSEAASAPAAEEILKGTVPVDVVLTDMAMPDPDDGLRVLRATLARNPDTPVIVLTAFGNIEGALDTIQKGAFDYLAKPFDVDAIVRVVRRALEQRRLVEENKSLRARVKQQELVGRSAAILEVYKQVARAAATNVPVLITGETGTGKEQVARSLHQRSPRSAARFVAVDCGAIAESLMESELFGHARGAFTGASGARRGLFEEATGGTRSATSGRRSRASSSGRCRRGRSAGWARARRSGWTSASSPPPTRTSRRGWPRGSSARTCSTAWTWCISTCRRSGRGGKTSRPWWTTSRAFTPAAACARW